MSLTSNLIDFALHIDVHLGLIIQEYGLLTYLILFLIIFCETGLVVTPFLPGDSLLFAAGAFAAKGTLNPVLLFLLLSIAAVSGDALNYLIGYRIGPKVFRMNIRFIKQDYLMHAQNFYEKYGNKTIMLSRFIPIIRTFAPFVAGVGKMNYSRFLLYNVIGGTFWVAVFVFGGYYFGGIPIVKENFSIVILAIIILSFIPAIFEYVRHKYNERPK